MRNKVSFFVGQCETVDHRNIFLFNLRGVVFRTQVAGIVPGEFPVDSWYPLLLEIPEGGSKACISGRFPGLLVGLPVSPVEWDKSRVVSLPIYENTERCRQKTVRGVMASKDLPDTVPIVTIANRYDGYYCDQRRAQVVSVLAVYTGGTSLLLELDWCEGSLEDCVSPEWYLQASSFLTIRDGLDRFKKVCRNSPMWEDCSFYLYVIPPFLGSYLLGRGKRMASKIWQEEWSYAKHSELMDASSQVIDVIVELGNSARKDISNA